MTAALRPYRDVIDEVVKLADEQPEHIAEGTYFRKSGQPECIFGCAFDRLGITPDAVTAAAIDPDDCSISHIYFADLGITAPTHDELAWSNAVQSRQDRGVSWGMAVAGLRVEQ